MAEKAVFLDRDGVINESIVRDGRPFPPRSVSEVIIPPGVRWGLSRLKAAGWLLVVVSNQPDVARGLTSISEVEAINSFLANRLPIDRFEICFHDDSDKCDCRKPLAGLLFRAASALNINLTQSFLVGDRWRDIEAGLNAGCKTMFIDYNYHERKPKDFDYRLTSLRDAVPLILGE